jgi:glycosyltransferase involved in cell wall biosynthesis
MQPLVSILIPAFNAEKWVGETIRSALAQTWARKEVIVVDDGSTDSTLSVAREFTSAHVQVATQQNKGAAAARNKALKLCQGDFIQWLDADDLIAPDKIEIQMHALGKLESARPLCSSAWGQFLYRTSKARFCPTALWNSLSAIEWLLRKVELNLYMHPASWLMSRELAEAAGPWDTRLTLDDDGEYFCRVVRHSAGVHFTPEAKAFYRQSGSGSLSNSGRTGKKLESQFLSLELQIRYIRSLEESERVRAACVKFLQPYLILFHPERPDIMEKAQELAQSLGGRLESPRLPREYELIQRLFGWSAAKRAQNTYGWWKESCRRYWDQAASYAERRSWNHGV